MCYVLHSECSLRSSYYNLCGAKVIAGTKPQYVTTFPGVKL